MRHLSRRQFLQHASHTAIAGLAAGCGTPTVLVRRGTKKPQRLSKEIFIPSQNDTGVFPGFITYQHSRKPILLHRFGWVDASDTYDNFHESVSNDNGVTWSAPAHKLASHAVEGGRVRYCENTAYFDMDTHLLITAVSRFFYPNDRFDQDIPRQVIIEVTNVSARDKFDLQTLDFSQAGGITISFCFPIKTSTGRIVIPATTPAIQSNGQFVHHPLSGSVVREVRMIIGAYSHDGSLSWHIGQPLKADAERSTRGFSESTVVELRDGRLALICRGSNAGAPDLPGSKWLSFSTDGGESWSDAVPLQGHDGISVHSSATGAACFRSIQNGRLYLIANLCPEGVRADGNWPRSPLVIAELQEEPFAVKRDTISIIDEREPNDSPRTQISNFRYYQDRCTGDVVVFASRFGEYDDRNWKRANYYRYRMALPS